VSTTSFGIMTAPSQVDYRDVLRVWQEADAIEEIEHAWLFDHLMPIFGNRTDQPSRVGRFCRRLLLRLTGCASGCSSPATGSDPRRCPRR
jgi:hypothetical protein